jgi:hypothetical protein
MPPFSGYEVDGSFSISSAVEYKQEQQQYYKRPRHSVRFAPCHDVCEIPHIHDLPQDVIESVWMSDEELSAVRMNCASILMNMDEELAAGVCFRGLEKHVPQYVENAMAIRRQVYDTIDAIQLFQATTGVAVPEELIAESCQQFSVQSDAVAQIQGINDAIEVYNQ